MICRLHHRLFRTSLSLVCALAFGTATTCVAATLCVNQEGHHGCFRHINDAVAHASPNDTIMIDEGVYQENVVIKIPLSLVGESAEDTIVDASGRSNAIYIDGIDSPGLKNVVVTGLTLRNADFEGLLVTNASSVTIDHNKILENDKSLNFNGGTCPGLPPFETNEGFDCGGGLHFIGVDHSTVSYNHMTKNLGEGFLVSDETMATHDNVITHNEVLNNVYDCGIVLASHAPASGSGLPLGIFHNTISENTSNFNGVSGEGAGIGMFSPEVGGRVSETLVIGNEVNGNGIPGVALHAHVPCVPINGEMVCQDLNNNVIVDNRLAKNGPDSGDTATSGPAGINIQGAAPISGTVITGNVITDEKIAVAIGTSENSDVHLNQFLNHQIGVDNVGGGGTVNATENWWGCSHGPANHGCARVAGAPVLYQPWLRKPPQEDKH